MTLIHLTNPTLSGGVWGENYDHVHYQQAIVIAFYQRRITTR